MLKETPKSLREYFTLISVLSLLPFILAAFERRWSAFASVSAVFNLCFIGLFIYIAVRFYALLRKPALILTVLTFGTAAMLVSYGVRLFSSGVDSKTPVILVISLLVYCYLFRSVTRLSREALQHTA